MAKNTWVAAPGDPVFYLHHCWIDLLWARWQRAHPGAPFVSNGAGVGLDDPLMEWPDRTPADVLDHHALDYIYAIETGGPILFYNAATGLGATSRLDAAGNYTFVGDCSRATGFSQPVHDEVLPEFVDGLRRELHATYPAQDAHGSALASAPGRHS